MLKRSLLVAALLIGALGCAGHQTIRKSLPDSARMFNNAVRWQNWGAARSYLKPSMQRWLKIKMTQKISYADWATLGVMPKGEAEAEVIVRRQFYTPTNTTIQEETMEQKWVKEEGVWFIASEAPFVAEEEPRDELAAEGGQERASEVNP